MVGVAGRSQGCHTCRRRRIRCDTGKPHCQRCRASGRICEGYARRAMFLNSTAQGPISPEEVLPSNVEERVSASSMPPQIRQSSAVRHQIESMFLEKYLASSNTTEWPSPGSYVFEVVAVLPHDWLLEPAIQALCVTKIGRVQQDIRLVQQGFQAYMLALKRLQFAISKPEHASSDSAFATAKILNLHEIYEPTLESVSGLYSHTAGLTSILLRRGSELKHSSKATRLILEASRYNAMIASIQKLQNSPHLAKAEWRTNARESITDFEQSLYDIGFDIGDLLADIERFKTQDADGQSIGESIAIKALSVNKSMASWYEAFTLWAPTPLFWKDSVETLSFPHITIAHICLDYWSLKIVLNTLLEKFAALIDSKYQDQESRKSLNVWATQRLARENHSETMTLANNIASAIHYCRQSTMGYVGPQRTMFANCISLSFYRRLDVQDKVTQVVNTMRELHLQNGLHFADDMKDPTLPGWATND